MLRRTLFVALLLVWVVLLLLRPSVHIAGDFYPVIHGSAWLLQGGDPYSDAFIADLKQHWLTPHATGGFSYPLPLALVVAPLALLPLPVAVLAWLALGIAGSYAVIGLQRPWRTMLALPLLYMPLWDAVFARQVTLVWFALVVGMVFAMRRRNAWFVGLAIALLPIKPQCGIFFAIYGVIWAWREQRVALAWAAGWFALCWGLAFVVQPSWVTTWITALGRYTIANQVNPLYIWALPLLVVTWHLPWPARIAALQIGLFPLIGMYTLLPLLLVWTYLGGRRALIGAALSWLYWPFIPTQSAALVCLFMIVPLLVCGYLDRRDHLRAKPMSPLPTPS